MCRYGLVDILSHIDKHVQLPWKARYADSRHLSPLCEATFGRQPETVQFLLATKFYDVDGSPEDRAYLPSMAYLIAANPLNLAALFGFVEMTRLLLQHRVNPLWHDPGRNFIPTALQMAVAGKGTSQAKLAIVDQMTAYLDSVRDLGLSGSTSEKLNWEAELSIMAASKQQEELMMLLLSRPVELGYQSSQRIVELLLYELLDADAPYLYRFKSESERISELPLTGRLPRFKSKITVLHVAFEHCSPIMVPHLLQKLAESENMAALNARDCDGRAPFHYLEERIDDDESGHILQILADHGADVFLISDHGVTVLHIAATTGSVELIAELIHKGHSIQALDRRGAGVLHFPASKRCCLSAARRLISYLERQFSVASTDSQGHSVVHYAAAMNNHYFLKAALARSPEAVHLTNRKGEIALYHADILHKVSMHQAARIL